MKQLQGIAAALLLLGCATTGGGSVSGVQIAADAQKIAVAVCAFEPTIDTVLNILATGDPLLMTAEAIAGAICQAVTGGSTKQAGADEDYVPAFMLAVYNVAQAAPPTVNGVVVHGKFTKKKK